MTAIPLPAVVVLVGPSGSGKTTWARERFAPGEVVSSDSLRAVVGSGEADLDASVDAFAVLDAIVEARVRRRLTTVIDTLGLDPQRRRRAVEAAHAAGLPAVAVHVVTDAATCRRRNRDRDHPVPADVLTAQLRRSAALELSADGFDLILTAGDAVRPEAAHAVGAVGARQRQVREPVDLRFALQLSQFPWGTDPRTWLRTVAKAAEAAGFSAVAVMDHLLQIPQVGRVWDPIPEAFTTLGFLAGVTTHVELGALVTPITFRSAPLLAKIVATLDVVSGGRAFCGLGAGWFAREHHAYDLDFPTAGTRVDHLEATIGVLRAFWAAGTKPYGDLPETTCYPRPLHDIAITVGGSGPRTLGVAARLADACNLPSTRDLAARLDLVQAQCEVAGRDYGGLHVSVLDTPLVAVDRAHAAGLVERHRGRQRAEAYASLHHAGPVDEHIGRYRLLADQGISTVFVALPDLTGPGEIERFAPIVSAFAGRSSG